jgi:hypothetical protein
LAYSATGLHDQAIAENNQWGALGASDIDVKIGRAYCFAAAERKSEALELVRHFELERPSNGNLMRGIALVFAAMGDADRAFEWFERGYVLKAESLGSLKIAPKVDPLRSDPRLADLIGRVGLPL